MKKKTSLAREFCIAAQMQSDAIDEFLAAAAAGDAIALHAACLKGEAARITIRHQQGHALHANETSNIKALSGVSRESANSLSTLLDPIAKAVGKEMFEALARDADGSTRREIITRARPVLAALKAARGTALPADVAQVLLPKNARRI